MFPMDNILQNPVQTCVKLIDVKGLNYNKGFNDIFEKRNSKTFHFREIKQARARFWFKSQKPRFPGRGCWLENAIQTNSIN